MGLEKHNVSLGCSQNPCQTISRKEKKNYVGRGTLPTYLINLQHVFLSISTSKTIQLGDNPHELISTNLVTKGSHPRYKKQRATHRSGFT
ncbi:hypothetical protein DUNSADRAFT_16540 [Dunaliella salina]|uniref:Encoded protein n=1 Tax=Dunaliella salina TaxID=3046 RepID=A0ABQ7G3C1_DUNSA|nr:hypothetical protein DUNSADRAFT_16540 [Dunaliella salina]|eukprot:KAF5829103.1 hypothetical protein DUNSADRAFT_16540 [Dunaliella salina]